jgi:hypothetical protein
MDYMFREYDFIQIKEAWLGLDCLHVVILSFGTEGVVNPNYPSYTALSLSPAFCFPIHFLYKA